MAMDSPSRPRTWQRYSSAQRLRRWLAWFALLLVVVIAWRICTAEQNWGLITETQPRTWFGHDVAVPNVLLVTGDLLSREVIASSGSQILDNAALASVEKAAPFPAFPAGITVDRIVEVVPYRFSVR